MQWTKNGMWKAGIVLVILTGWVSGMTDMVVGAPPSLAPTDQHPETLKTISIKARQFSPSILHLRVGQKTRLMIHNSDAELHAFVPLGLLSRIALNITGNGAPEFSKEGLRRILLPSNGRAEILFVPKQAGTFMYYCDLPGHRMKGKIVVHDAGF